MSRKELWSGRFRKQLDPGALKFTSSPEDALLFRHDIAGSIAHAMGLERAGIISSKELKILAGGLRNIYSRFAADPERILSGEEDVHMAVERKLTEMHPGSGPRLHTGRSRNDQVALDLRLYSREGIVRILSSLMAVEESILSVCGKHISAPLPSYTHLQRAQPVYLSHYYLAHFWRFMRDIQRLQRVFDSLNISPLGAGAIAGSSQPLEPSFTSSLLGFSMPFENSIDASSDRDFCLDTVHACVMAALHLSAIAEEIVLWSTAEFGYVSLPDSLSTGSSLMPHKKNPDLAELVRGKCGSVTGNFVSMVVSVKGLPLGYSRDLQELKKPLFESIEEVSSMAETVSEMVSGISFNTERMAENASDQLSFSVEAVDGLVRSGMPFREAHGAVGKAVAESMEKGIGLGAVMRKSWPDVEFPESPAAAIEMRSSPGGSSLTNVRKQIAASSAEMASARKWMASRSRLTAAVDDLLSGK